MLKSEKKSCQQAIALNINYKCMFHNEITIVVVVAIIIIAV